MFTFAVPDTQHAARSREYLRNNWIDFEEKKDNEGFTHISFPGVEEGEFRKIVIKLKTQGVTMIGVDTALTEKKIMKLASLLETPLEQFDEDEITEKDLVGKIKDALKGKGERGKFEVDPTSKFWEAIADAIGDYEEQDDYDKGFYTENKKSNKAKLRKLIRKTIRE